MKKIQVIFTTVAISMAAAGVYAGTLNTFEDWKHTMDGAICSGARLSAPPYCDFMGAMDCYAPILIGEEEVYFYFSRQELDENGQQVNCLQYKQP